MKISKTEIVEKYLQELLNKAQQEFESASSEDPFLTFNVFYRKFLGQEGKVKYTVHSNGMNIPAHVRSTDKQYVVYTLSSEPLCNLTVDEVYCRTKTDFDSLYSARR